MARAAFFDMDLTLLRVNSGSRWVKYLRKRGEIGLPMRFALYLPPQASAGSHVPLLVYLAAGPSGFWKTAM